MNRDGVALVKWVFVSHTAVSFHAVIRKLVYSFWQRLGHCDNVINSPFNLNWIELNAFWGRKTHICRVAGNTMWSLMACEFSQRWGRVAFPSHHYTAFSSFSTLLQPTLKCRSHLVNVKDFSSSEYYADKFTPLHQDTSWRPDTLLHKQPVQRAVHTYAARCAFFALLHIPVSSDSCSMRCARDSNSMYFSGGVHTYTPRCAARYCTALVKSTRIFTSAAQQSVAQQVLLATTISRIAQQRAALVWTAHNCRSLKVDFPLIIAVFIIDSAEEECRITLSQFSVVNITLR